MNPLMQANEFMGRFYHIFDCYSYKYLPFPLINIAQIHLDLKKRWSLPKMVFLDVETTFRYIVISL